MVSFPRIIDMPDWLSPVVMGADDNPLTLYHGTYYDFDYFRPLTHFGLGKFSRHFCAFGFGAFAWGGAGRVVQRTLNSFLDANLVVDGAIGSETMKSINAIPDSKVNEFMVALKSERINYLKDTPNWKTAKNGWLKRVNKY